jgi:hypothetical protein
MKKRALYLVAILVIIIFLTFMLASDSFNIFKKQSPAMTGDVVIMPDNIPMPNTAKCIDSDGGVFSEIAGNVSVRKAMQWGLGDKRYNVYYDYCIRNTTLVEYYCNRGTVKSTRFACKEGCKNGRCLDDCNITNLGGVSFIGLLSAVVTKPNAPVTFTISTAGVTDDDFFNKHLSVSVFNGTNEIDRIMLRGNLSVNGYSSLSLNYKEGEYIFKICGWKNIINNNKLIVTSNIKCLPLYEDKNNNASKDRINIIFLGDTNFGNLDTLKNISKQLISIEGNYTYLPKQQISRDSWFDPAIDWGLFSIEPFKSNKNKFNIWYVNRLFEKNITLYIEKADFCDLNYSYLAILNNGEGTSGGGASTTENTPDLFKKNLTFYRSFNFVPIYDHNIIRQRLTFVHETMHGLFLFPDEYVGSGTASYSYPDCARNLSEAKSWWEDMIGQVDDMYYTYSKAVNESNVLSYMHIGAEDDFRVGYIYGGCGLEYGDPRVVKPTKGSVMSDYLEPVLGSVNSRRVQQIMDLFSGG